MKLNNTNTKTTSNELCVVFIVTLTQAARQSSFPWLALKTYFSFYFTLNTTFNGTLTQIWNSHYLFVFTQKQYPENFAFFILIILELFALAVCKFLKKQANFEHILLFLNVCKQIFLISIVRISQKVKGVLNSTYYFHMKIWYWQIFKSVLVHL